MRKKIALKSLLIPMVFIIISSSGVKAADQFDDLDRDVREAMQTFQVPGLAVGILKDNQIIYKKGYGVQSIEKKNPVDTKTSFAIGSISKSTVVLCLARLYDKRALHWDDAVTDYLPEFQMYDPWVTREITVRDLLTHRSGLRSVSGGTIWYGSDYSREDVIHKIRYLIPVTSFRSQYAYQNIMFVVAARIIPALSGSSWEEYVKEHFFQALNMDRTTVSLSELENLSNVATPHAIIEGRLQTVPYRNYDNIGPAASVNSCVDDMLKYIHLLLNKGQYQGHQYYSHDLAQTMWTPQMNIPVSEPDTVLTHTRSNFKAYGLGWFIKDYRGQKLVYHSGGVDGNRALVMMLPAENLGIVILTNQEEWRIYYALAYRIIDEILGFSAFNYLSAYQQLRDQAQAEKAHRQEERMQSQRQNTQPTLALDRYAGIYRDRMYGDVRVNCQGDSRLMLQFSHTPAFRAELVHWHYNTFRILWQDPLIPEGLMTFILNAEGQIERLKLDQPDLLDVDFDELELIRTANSN